MFFNYEIDIYSGKASDWLTFNRNSLSSKGKKEINNLIEENLKLWITRNLDVLLNASQENNKSPELSALANSKSLDPISNSHQFWKGIATHCPDEWKKLPCKVVENKSEAIDKCIADVLSIGKCITNARYESNCIYPDNLKIAFLPNLCQIAINEWLKETDNAIRFSVIELNHEIIRYPNFEAIELIKKEEDKNQIQVKKRTLIKLVEGALAPDMPRRFLLPVQLLPSGFDISALELKPGVKFYGGRYLLSLTPYPLEHFVIPYLISLKSEKPISLDGLDGFVRWMHNNQKNPIDIKSTENAVKEVIGWFDDLMKDSIKWQDLIKKSGLKQLHL